MLAKPFQVGALFRGLDTAQARGTDSEIAALGFAGSGKAACLQVQSASGSMLRVKQPKEDY
jgi:hypothetical protein